MAASTDVSHTPIVDSPARGAAARPPAGGVREHALLGVIVLALVYLVLLPLFTHSRVRSYLAEIAERVDPARAAATEVQLALALEAANTRAYLLSGEPQYSASFRAAREDRQAAMARLVAHSGALDSDVQRQAADVARQLETADVLLTQLHTGQMLRDEYTRGLPLQHARFIDVTRTVGQLRRSIDRIASDRRAHIRRIHVADVALTGAGVLLVGVALLALARLSRGRRDLAEREQRARARVEDAYAQAERRRDALDALRASQRRLIRGFSHDLKNPLGAAEGYLVTLERGLRGRLSDAQADCVARSRRALQGAVQLIDDLVELARTERDDIEVRPIHMDLRAVAVRVVEDYRAQAEAKGLVITTELPAGPLAAHSDPERVAQVLGNLLNNAIKYTDSGLITVTVGVRRDERERACGVVDVVDTGPGIPSEYHDRIFDEFQRLDGAAPAAGAGIGLAISQRIAERLDGRLTVASAMRAGSAFTLWLPLASDPAPSGMPQPADRGNGAA